MPTNRSKRRLYTTGFACIVALLIMTAAQVVMAERLPLKTYTTAEGLPHNAINKIVRDSRGFLWFCTEDGLSRFDGYSFTNYGVDQGLPHRNVTDFLETRSGELWLGTSAGLVKFNPKGVPTKQPVYSNESGTPVPMFTVVVPEDDDKQARVVNVLLEGHDGTILCGAWIHLYRLQKQDGKFHLTVVDV